MFKTKKSSIGTTGNSPFDSGNINLGGTSGKSPFDSGNINLVGTSGKVHLIVVI